MISEAEVREREARAYERGICDADRQRHIPDAVISRWVNERYPAIAERAVDAELGHTVHAPKMSRAVTQEDLLELENRVESWVSHSATEAQLLLLIQDVKSLGTGLKLSLAPEAWHAACVSVPGLNRLGGGLGARE